MKRLLIVDDERIERDGIRMLVQDMKLELEVLEAANGKKALQILDERKVDFMITDIKMPFMSGLELIRASRENYPRIEIAILSGYGEFAYAQEAIKYGVANYILKPVDPEEFRKTIDAMLEKSASQEHEKEEKEQTKAFLNKYFFQKYLFTGNEDYLNRILSGENYGLDGNDIKGTQNLMLVESAGNFFENCGQEVIQELQQRLGRALGYLDLNENQILLIFYHSASDNYPRIAESVYEAVKEQFGVECYVAVGRKIRNLKECPQEYQALENLMENKFYHTDTRIFSMDEEIEGESQVRSGTDYQKKLKEDIRLKDFTHLWDDYKKMNEQIQSDGNESQMYLKFLYSELVKELFDSMGSEESPRMKTVIGEIYQAADLAGIYHAVEESFREFETRKMESEDGVRSDVEKVKAYIHAHYGETLGIERLAGEVYLSPGYLSYIFKKETGMNLSRYIKEYRMEKAKELLRDTNMKIVKICSSVGFSNVSYFCQSFREYCGVSPEKYRKGELDDDALA